MANAVNLFHNKYDKVIRKLMKEELQHFKDTDDGGKRIELLYPYLQAINIDITTSEKNHKYAVKYKLAGNKFYLNKNNLKALELYNNGILVCPQNDTESRETLSILIANRSACLYDERRYESALKDINCALSIKDYPQKLQYKLFIRKAKCYLCCNPQIDLILESYNMALKQLEFAQIDQKDFKIRKYEIEVAIKEINTLQLPTSFNGPVLSNFFSKVNPTYKNANELVTFNYQPELGRYAAAHKDIDVGTVLINEPADCAVLIHDYHLTNCHHCMLSTDTPIACDFCCNVIFCSLDCKEDASSYHKFECSSLKALVESGASINCQMALRLITQQPLKNLKTNTDCNGIYSLCRNEQQRTIEGILHYTIMAIFLLRLLKTSSYFGVDCNDSSLTEDEIFIAKLLIRNLETLEFNAHEISEFQEHSPMNATDEGNVKSVYIGGGLYSTAALFNHACDPSVVRYNIGSRIIVKAIKPIKKGDIIYENYGPIYTNMIREERRSFLLERYWFACACQACTEDWPLLVQMTDDTVKISCNSEHCNGGVNMHEVFVNNVCCDCNKSINVLPRLKALSELEVMLPKAETFYKSKDYKEAAKIYMAAINIYYKHTVPPFPDWVKVQQRLRTCLVSEGNKNIQSVFK